MPSVENNSAGGDAFLIVRDNMEDLEDFNSADAIVEEVKDNMGTVGNYKIRTGLTVEVPATKWIVAAGRYALGQGLYSMTIQPQEMGDQARKMWG
ncbi:hypothetical protein FUAX_53300 (plasmid) [Fulvitalea axinellae]|uniref:Uncharacterized protein n=1 Tax=Fulvitalea axinellae TaxID=1182444 RepID=A0AAU9CS04_9BACT|nr:hypothetical protein FUAX_53300 [Fulvitalea axinellae]